MAKTKTARGGVFGGGRGRTRNKRGMMRKVSKRGAYKKGVKNQMVTRRAPIVETKQRVQGDIDALNGLLPSNDYHPAPSLGNCLDWKAIKLSNAFTFIPLEAYYRNSHGLQDYNMIGDTIFSKYLNCRFEFRFPDSHSLVRDPQFTGQGEAPYARNEMYQYPTKLYLICGWVTEPSNFPITKLSSKTNAQDATQANLREYISENLLPYFDDDQDKLLFRPKQTTNIKIDKYVRIKPANDSQVTAPPRPITYTETDQGQGSNYQTFAQGSIPDVSRSWSVKTNRKLTHTLGVPANNSAPTAQVPKPDDQNYFLNNSWLPFAIIYNPQYQEQLDFLTENYAPQNVICQNLFFRFNVAHYYTDG